MSHNRQRSSQKSIESTKNKVLCILGLTQWNRNSFEFKFYVPDFPHNIKIRLARLIFFCCVLTLLCLFPVGCLSFLNWDSQQGRDRATLRPNKKSIRPILFLYYEESLVSSNLNSNYFGFIVSDLMYVLTWNK